ncbi:MAG: hypothetical protein ACLUVP_07595 [Acutalibacter sp.]
MKALISEVVNTKNRKKPGDGHLEEAGEKPPPTISTRSGVSMFLMPPSAPGRKSNVIQIDTAEI